MSTSTIEPISEGKTKWIFPIAGNPAKVIIQSKDDITAGDGAKHDLIAGKAALATRTTSNVFRLLKACGIPVAFDGYDGGTSFIADKCAMLPYEVVIRREAHGSYLKRAPYMMKGNIFPRLLLEFFLKTSGKKWKQHELVCDDPLMDFDSESEKIYLYDPKQPMLHQTYPAPFLALAEAEVFTQADEETLLGRMGDIARQTFLVLEKAWQIQGRTLVDFKVEFGINTEGKLLLADVIDNDSWRVIDGTGKYIDKQVYRDGGDLDTVTAKYREVADITDRFEIPFQRLIVWCGSKSDKFTAVEELATELNMNPCFNVRPIACSAHKEPARAYQLLQRSLQEVPDTVIIAYVGRSNGLGPILAANSTIPMIAVPAEYKGFPEDVWSSLRAPSNVPVMTVLEPKNAALAALQILAMRNPCIYAAVRFEQEKRLSNFLEGTNALS